jgi:Cys-rich four helix bundle protein (predicted Tat secretion target)
MNRRELFSVAAGAAGAAAFMAATPAFAGDDQAKAAAPAPNAHQALFDAAMGCVKAGEVCMAHCLSTFAAGDTMLATCARLVEEASGMCAALAKLAAIGSERLAIAAKATMEFCDACEKECRKHGDHHATCKACAEACAACIVECKKTSA